jgi:hypothetical protein
MRTTHEVIEHLRREFDELPGLSLTPPQAQRLCSIEAHVCAAVLRDLLRDGFLSEDRGRYRRNPVVPLPLSGNRRAAVPAR